MAEKNAAAKVATQAAHEERWGIALSGGGFRAAFYHVGVLAYLADRGLLRRIEVISTVSGGSIVGALYYLHLKRLLEAKTDAEIQHEDYVALVAQVEKELRAVVQTNLRMRTFDRLGLNLKMAWRRDYSRTNRIGELLNDSLYAPVAGEKPLMSKMRIAPRHDLPAEQFRPQVHNPRRVNKVPALKINASVLNSGHNWRFEAVTMGEPDPVEEDDWARLAIDRNERFQRASGYWGYVHDLRDFTLGEAVAASAAVPVVFPPLALIDAYGQRVQLVDGGVHDNQGIQGLMDHGHVTRFFVSDACGQMGDDADPGTNALEVALRVNSILQDRIREEQLIDLKRDHGPHAVVVHLRKGLDAAVLPPWQPPMTRVDPPALRHGTWQFGVDPRVQDLLARLRTDLDAFSDAEVYALEYDGYVMARHELSRCEGSPLPYQRPPAEWAFAAIADQMENPSGRFLELLSDGQNVALKPFRVDPRLKAAGVLSAGAATVLGVAGLARLAGFSWTAGVGAGLGVLLLGASLLDARVRKALLDALRGLWRFSCACASTLGGVAGVAVSFVWLRGGVNGRWLLAGRLDRIPPGPVRRITPTGPDAPVPVPEPAAQDAHEIEARRRT